MMSRLASITARTRLPLAWYARDARTIARELLGCLLVRTLDDGTRLSGIIVETEAYLGVRDAASHAFRGRRTPRNEAMYAKGGTSYVYFTYGMHWCFNVVVGVPEDPLAVLIRALEPVEGLDAIRMHRTNPRSRGVSLDSHSVRIPSPVTDLCSGPARLCQALAIDRSLNAIDLTRDARLWIEPGAPVPARHVACGPRIGIDYAGSWAARKLRYWIRNNPHVSRPGPKSTGSARRVRKLGKPGGA